MERTGKCIVMAAGDLTVSQVPMGEEDLCIAVDGGYEYCRMLGLHPHYILGDFDSLPAFDGSGEAAQQLDEIRARTPQRVVTLPPEKDETDTFAALKLGLSLGYKEFLIYGGMGGRLEHTIANIQCLRYLKEQGAAGYLMDGTGMVLVAKEEKISFRPSLEGYLSLFPAGEEAVVSIENMKYELRERTLVNTDTLGVSNEFIGKKASVTVHRGAVVVIVSWAEE